MFARRKQRFLDRQRKTALALGMPDAAPQRVFPSEITNNFRHMLTRLTYGEALSAKSISRISFVSALQQEGVTYTALAFATTMAHDLHAEICLVDLNWWSPGLPAALALPPLPRRWWQRRKPQEAAVELPRSPGLAAVLNGTASLEEALLPTAMSNLQVLPAGELPLEQRPIVARSEQLRACIETLSEYFHYVLLDVPAVLTTSDAIALASLGDACCMVIRQGVTPVNSVRAALDDLKHLHMLGVVLNQTTMATPRWITALVPQE
jgi:Mrp family chromosome partitioning ATPase